MANAATLHMIQPDDQPQPPPADAEGPSLGAPHPGEEAGAAAKGEGGKPSSTSGKAQKRQVRKPSIDTGVLTRLYRDFAYQYGSEVAWDVENRMPIRISHLRHTFGHDAVKLWMGSPKRRVIMPDQVVFDPSQACSPECVNLFTGWGVEAVEGDTAPFHALLEFLCGGDELGKDWVLNWLAWPLQHPGQKLPTALVFHGAEGTGKSYLFESVLEIHGKHGKVVGQRELESQWNDWQSGCTMVIGDEVVSRTEMRHHKGVLKALITSKDVNIATKFMSLRSERNCMHLVFLSNEIEPLKLDPSDRRYLVVWTPRKGDASLYQAAVAWRQGGGAAALLHELLARDLSGWASHAPPPMTQAKEDLIELGRQSPERFWREWKRNEIGLPHHSCSADQAYRAYARWCRLEGERYPMSKPVFSRYVAREADAALTVKLARVGASSVVRMWLVTPPPDSDFGAWAREAVDAFESELRGWIGDAS